MTCVDQRPIYGPITNASPAWTGAARSNVQFETNCYYGFEVSRAAVGVVCGLNDLDESTGYRDVNYAFYFTRGTVTIWENGVARGTPHVYVDGTRFYIVRVGTAVFYCERPFDAAPEDYFTSTSFPAYKFPGVILYVSHTPSYGLVFLDVSMYAVGDTIFDEVAGTEWHPGADTMEVPDPSVADIGGELPFAGLMSAGVTAGIYGFLPFEVVTRSTHDNMIRGQLVITGFMSDISLATLMRGNLPFTGELGEGVTGTVDGIGGQLAFTCEARTRPLTTRVAGAMPFTGLAIGLAPGDVMPTSIAYGEIPFSMLAISSYQPDNVFRINLSFSPVADEPPGESDILETFYVSTDIEYSYAAKLRDKMRVIGTPKTFYNPATQVLDVAAAKVVLKSALTLSVRDEITAIDNLTYAVAVKIAERLRVQGLVDTFYHGLIVVLSAMAIRDKVVPAASASMLDELHVTDPLQHELTLLVQLLDEISIADSHEIVLTIIVEEVAHLQAQDSLQLTSHLFADLLDEVEVLALLKTSTDIAQGWVLNTEKNMPISEYDNYEFNALTWYQGVLYGTADTGLYQMGADDDAGEPITAQLASMFLDFESGRMKRIRSAYMGYTSTNELVLKVRSISDGQLSEQWYKATGNTPDAPERGRMLVGNKLRSRYWQFELTNVDGGDFEVDKIELYPIFLGRRV